MLIGSSISDAERKQILSQTDRLSRSPFFRGSSRYPSLLKFIVDRTLDGKRDSLKERTIGIEVFGRPPDFDSGSDSIVRVAAAEVRKRLAQYYQEAGHENEVRIELLPGSYVPHFRFLEERDEAEKPSKPSEPTLGYESPAQSGGSEGPVPPSPGRSALQRFELYSFGLAFAFVLALLVFSVVRSHKPTSLLSVLWASSSETRICVGSVDPYSAIFGRDQAQDPLGQPGINNTLVPYGDALALARLEREFASHQKAYRIAGANVTTYDELQKGPAVFIGAFDNDWTLRVTQNLRFRFVRPDVRHGLIVDTKGNSSAHWTVDYELRYSDIPEDFALVGVVTDSLTGQPVAIAAGIGPNGTMAAAEFLTDPDSVSHLRGLAPKGWNGRNFEAVISAQVVNGYSGPARVLSAEFW